MKKVLLVEDDRLVTLITSIVFEEMGYAVDTAATGKEALEKVNQSYDFILMDIGLPDMDGISVTKKIRESEEVNKRTPIIALTARVEESTKAQALAAGMNAYLTKPLDNKKLEAVLSELT